MPLLSAACHALQVDGSLRLPSTPTNKLRAVSQPPPWHRGVRTHAASRRLIS